MIARLIVVVPQSFAIPEGEQFSIFEYEIDGCKVRIYPPVKTDVPVVNETRNMTIDRVPAASVNGMRIEFQKEDFDRRISSECDPSIDFIATTIKSLLLRLRFVTAAYMLRQIDFPYGDWRMQYLHDDETELEATEGLLRARGGVSAHLSWITVDNEIWNDFNALPFEYEPPSWTLLLLDATEALPNVGSAIVLAATALEVFVAKILDDLADRSEVPADIWEWVNDRQWLKDPSVEEQFGELMRILLGTSLKENKLLWEGFMNLKNARNSFVHGGQARIGSRIINEVDARSLIGKANEIVVYVRSKLPPDLQWPVYERAYHVQAQTPLWSNTATGGVQSQ